MLISDVVNKIGGGSYSETARKLGMVASAPLKWKVHGDMVPIEVALVAEEMTGGELKFDKAPYLAKALEKYKAKG